MALSGDILEAIKATVNESVKTAVNDSVNNSVTEAMKSNISEFKDSLEMFNKTMHDIVNKQVQFENRCEDRINTINKAIDSRQAEAEARNAEKFAYLEKKVSDLSDAIKSSVSFPSSAPPQQNEVYQQAAFRTRPRQPLQTHQNMNKIESIKQAVSLDISMKFSTNIR